MCNFMGVRVTNVQFISVWIKSMNDVLQARKQGISSINSTYSLPQLVKVCRRRLS